MQPAGGRSDNARMLRKLLELKPRDVPFVVALRNTAAVVVPLALGVATDHIRHRARRRGRRAEHDVLDQPGPYRLRMQRMLLAAIAAGISAFVGCVVGASTPAT